MTIRLALACAGIPLCALSVGAQAQTSTLISQRNLSFDAALQAATTALETCRKNGFRVTVTVLDRSGRTRVVLHDDNVSPHTLENSLRKAYTALTFRIPSGDMGKRIAANPTATSPLLLDKVTSAQGALPIKAGNDIVGSIGVSGAPGGDKDEVCSQAGIDKIAAGLN
ncbi:MULTISPECIES: heme-binding protein [unclassified Beijerinckia]|uniref:GlcG/HbpS family heme-binding protein n=1 Tax=unclassified Beijerinckia TaxID=2638183 RepID=UPI00089C295F|nr:MULTISPECIES: heme-binding protein [unclassified Beijerinckia]MDH7795919.1 uncharacterized protein GlcG (DUF336 family) [Beijerinckia sp. GAS462]SEC22225.1 Uncharacterized conserved protein GlcG, DUF336 family [Beijerinckia sp. 28-YEA-48]